MLGVTTCAACGVLVSRTLWSIHSAIVVAFYRLLCKAVHQSEDISHRSQESSNVRLDRFISSVY